MNISCTAFLYEINSQTHISPLKLQICYKQFYFFKTENKSLLSHNLDEKICFFLAGGFYSCRLNAVRFVQGKEDADPLAKRGTFTISENQEC